jgi:Cys-rich protein (TIGR01571 family)
LIARRAFDVSNSLTHTMLDTLVVGRTASRLRDPSDLSPEAFNGDCAIHGVLTLFFGSGWIYSMIKRGDIRERFNIPGSGFGDCCAAFWCQCCQVIQSDNEVKKRLLVSGPISQGYEPQTEGMQVPPAYQDQK